MLLLRIGWRWSFAATGFLSLLYFLLFWKIYRDPADDAELTETERNYIADDNTRHSERASQNKPPSAISSDNPKSSAWSSASEPTTTSSTSC